jgi:tRNA uracil 4-sulfurtransferase
MQPIVVAHYHEIALKGKNRFRFERQLVLNMRWALRSINGVRVKRMSGRVAVRFDDPSLTEQVATSLLRVFGIEVVLSGFEVDADPKMLSGQILEALERFPGDVAPESFAVRVRRANKSYPENSLSLERRLGAAICSAYGWPVNLRQPDLLVRIEIVESSVFVLLKRLEGPGGLPVGVSGRVLCLLSGGFDSPVAAWRMMRRGCVVDFVHFHSYPYTSDASQRNVAALVEVLREWQHGEGSLLFVALIDYQKQVMITSPADFRVLLYRRMMLRVAQEIGIRFGSGALVTGESVGQVASQTVTNIAAVAEVVDVPIFRPLIGTDKREIIQRAERIGTSKISARPHDDCCSLFVPSHPATAARGEDLDRAEESLELPNWVRALTLAAIEYKKSSLDERGDEL